MKVIRYARFQNKYFRIMTVSLGMFIRTVNIFFVLFLFLSVFASQFQHSCIWTYFINTFFFRQEFSPPPTPPNPLSPKVPLYLQ